MLNLLIEYAQREGIIAEPGFTQKQVHWALLFDEAGRFLGAHPLGLDDKKHPGEPFNRCPNLTLSEIKAGGTGCRHFLVDSAEVVTLLTKADAEPDTKLRAKHAYFVDLLRQAAIVEPRLGPITDALADPDALGRIRQALAGQTPSAKTTQNVTFAIQGVDGVSYLVRQSTWHDWWRAFRKTLSKDKAGRKARDNQAAMRCLASGELVTPASVHPKITGLSDVGGLAMGDSLASFKQDAFRSFGLAQSANAAMSEEMAKTYAEALNHLIRHAVSLAGAKVAYWYAGEVPGDAIRLVVEGLDDLLGPGAAFDDDSADAERDARARARALMEAVKAGDRHATDLGSARYYALTLSGAGGRVMVRDWMQGQFADLATSVTAWFDDLAIVRTGGDGEANSPRLNSILHSLLPPRPAGQTYENWTKPITGLRQPMWHAALRRQPIPDAAAAKVLLQHRSFVVTGEFETAFGYEGQWQHPRSLLHIRMGLLKAFLNRKSNPGEPTMESYLNEEHPAPAYHCGRLLAVLTEIQRRALPNVSAGITQRYYGAASTTPGLVLGRLIQLCQHHLAKPDLREDTRIFLESRLGAIACRIGDRIPPTLTLEQQSLFALGYYQQKANMYSRKAEAAIETDEATTASE